MNKIELHFFFGYRIVTEPFMIYKQLIKVQKVTNIPMVFLKEI